MVGEGEGQEGRNEVFRTCCCREGEKHWRPTPALVGEAPQEDGRDGEDAGGRMVRWRGSVTSRRTCVEDPGRNPLEDLGRWPGSSV